MTYNVFSGTLNPTHSLMHYLAIQPSRLQVCCNKISCQLSTEGDRINQSRRNLAGKRIPWVCYSTPNLVLIDESGSVQEPPKCQNLPKIVFFGHRQPTMNTFRWNLVYKCRPRVCFSTPNLALIGKRGSVEELPKVKICPKSLFLATGSQHSECVQMKFGV